MSEVTSEMDLLRAYLHAEPIEVIYPYSFKDLFLESVCNPDMLRASHNASPTSTP